MEEESVYLDRVKVSMTNSAKRDRVLQALLFLEINQTICERFLKLKAVRAYFLLILWKITHSIVPTADDVVDIYRARSVMLVLVVMFLDLCFGIIAEIW